MRGGGAPVRGLREFPADNSRFKIGYRLTGDVELAEKIGHSEPAIFSISPERDLGPTEGLAVCIQRNYPAASSRIV